MKKKWTKEKARELIDYYNNHSSEETSTEYQIASQSVRAIVSRLSKKYNIPIDRKIKWTEEKARELIEYYSSHTAKETAEKYQIANSHIHSAVNHFSKKYNISKDIKDTTKWTKEKARELIKYYNSHTTKETAEKYQMSIRSIMSIVNRLSKKYNIPWIKKKDGKIEWTEEKAREFIEYYSFHTAKETSMEYQLAIGTVSGTCHRLSKKYNIPIEKK